MALSVSDRAVLKQAQTQLETTSSHAREAEKAVALVLTSLSHNARNRPALQAIQSDTQATIRRSSVLAARVRHLLTQEPR